MKLPPQVVFDKLQDLYCLPEQNRLKSATRVVNTMVKNKELRHMRNKLYLIITTLRTIELGGILPAAAALGLPVPWLFENPVPDGVLRNQVQGWHKSAVFQPRPTQLLLPPCLVLLLFAPSYTYSLLAPSCTPSRWRFFPLCQVSAKSGQIQ